MKIKSIAAAFALAATVLAVPAHADNLSANWGTHDMAELGLGYHFAQSGSFIDTFSFNLALTSDLSSVTVANNLPQIFGIANGMVSLFSGVAGDNTADTLVGSYSFNGTTGETQHAFNALTSGNYFYQVKGDLTGALGGNYLLTSSAVASSPALVPEPETYAMLLAGLGVVGIAARRRVK